MLPRRLRNRLSQKAFRERQAAYRRDLERRLGDVGKSDNERIAELELENTRLRQALLDCRGRLEATQVTIATLSKSLGEVLGAQVGKSAFLLL